MILKEPRVEFVNLSLNATVNTSASITFCQQISGINVGEASWCAEIGYPSSASHSEICTTFPCQTDTSNEDNEACGPDRWWDGYDPD